jgi:hypothetical protein
MVERTSTLSRVSHVLIVILMLVGIAIPGSAQPSGTGQQSTTRLLPVSSVLTDAAGQPRRGSAVVTFGLFDAQQDGTLLWMEVQDVQADDRGRISAPYRLFRKKSSAANRRVGSASVWTGGNNRASCWWPFPTRSVRPTPKRSAATPSPLSC